MMMQGRLYRITELFSLLEFNMNISLLVVTLIRNFTVGGMHHGCPFMQLLATACMTLLQLQ